LARITWGGSARFSVKADAAFVPRRRLFLPSRRDLPLKGIPDHWALYAAGA